MYPAKRKTLTPHAATSAVVSVVHAIARTRSFLERAFGMADHAVGGVASIDAAAAEFVGVPHSGHGAPLGLAARS